MQINEQPQSKFSWIKRRPWIFVLVGLSCLILACGLIFLVWFIPKISTPLAESLELPEKISSRFPEWTFQDYTPQKDQPVCGTEKELLVLLAGIDYRSGDYLYGLADVIRLIHVDFTIPRVNVVALPRALLVETPEGRIDVKNPIMLNQAYFFGSPGMDKYQGTGYGAGALAETIHYNFGLRVDHYLVIDFNAFSQLIDTLGGVEVNLPGAVVIDDQGTVFPAGIQTLTGEQALQLARARTNTSDNVRISHQTVIMQGIFERMKSPSVWIKLPEILLDLRDAVITDATPGQIQDALCLLNKLESTNLHFFQPGEDLMTAGWEYIPSMDKQMNIYTWEEPFLDWLYSSLYDLSPIEEN